MAETGPQLGEDVWRCAVCKRKPLVLIWSPLSAARSQFVTSGACSKHAYEVKESHMERFDEASWYPSFDGDFD